jgi:hypothetical protein
LGATQTSRFANVSSLRRASKALRRTDDPPLSTEVTLGAREYNKRQRGCEPFHLHFVASPLFSFQASIMDIKKLKEVLSKRVGTSKFLPTHLVWLLSGVHTMLHQIAWLCMRKRRRDTGLHQVMWQIAEESLGCCLVQLARESHDWFAVGCSPEWRVAAAALVIKNVRSSAGVDPPGSSQTANMAEPSARMSIMPNCPEQATAAPSTSVWGWGTHRHRFTPALLLRFPGSCFAG